MKYLVIHRGQVQFVSNHAGGILGGISTGQPVVARMAVKPTSSLPRLRNSINIDGQNVPQNVTVRVTGRHDPCVGIRAVPVAEAMVAITLADHLLRHRAQCGSMSQSDHPMTPSQRTVQRIEVWSLPKGICLAKRPKPLRKKKRVCTLNSTNSHTCANNRLIIKSFLYF